MGRTSYTSNMFSLKLVLCVCMFFVIGMEGAPKPKPKAEPKPQPKAEPKPQPKAEPKPFPPIRYPPYIPGANPGPGNWNGFPPTRGDYHGKGMDPHFTTETEEIEKLNAGSWRTQEHAIKKNVVVGM